MARAVLFLLESDYITGTILPVDGDCRAVVGAAVEDPVIVADANRRCEAPATIVRRRECDVAASEETAGAHTDGRG